MGQRNKTTFRQMSLYRTTVEADATLGGSLGRRNFRQLNRVPFFWIISLSSSFTSIETVWLSRDGERWGSGTYEYLVPALRPVKTAETVSHRQNNSVQEVGTPPVPSNLCYSSTCSFNSCAEQSHKDSVRRATVEEQLKQRVVQLYHSSQGLGLELNKDQY